MESNSIKKLKDHNKSQNNETTKDIILGKCCAKNHISLFSIIEKVQF